MNKSMKWVIVGIIILVIVVAVIAINNNKNNANVNGNTNTEDVGKNYTETEDGTKVNTSEDVAKDKVVSDVLLEQSKIVFENGTSKLTSKVTNNEVAKDNLRFKVKFIANDNSVMAESVGFAGKIKANEVKYIDSYITIDVSNAKDVVYELMP